MNRIAAFGLVALLSGVLFLGGCESSGDDGITVDALGAVAGLVWVDRNGNGELDTVDGPVEDVGVELVPGAGGDAAYTAQSGSNGVFLIEDVMVGDYEAVVDDETFGDTLSVLRVDSADVTVEAGDTAVVQVALSYPSLSTDSVRRIPADRRVFVNGVVLSPWNVFGDQTLHVRDSTGAIRGVRVQPVSVTPGDSVRLLGRTSVQSGQAVITDVATFLVQSGVESPPEVPLTTAEAAVAGGGELDAELVVIDSAVVVDTARTELGELTLEIDDGTGPVDVVLDGSIPFQISFQDQIIGTIVEVVGVLVPSGPGGDWVLKPRSSADVDVLGLVYPLVPIDEARDEPLGTRLIVRGVALNGWTTFADSTVHVRDTTGAIRAVRVPPTGIATGDTIRLIGTIGVSDGEPVLTRVISRILATGLTAPEPVPVTAAGAATAGDGALAADLVRIDSAVVRDTTRNGAGEAVLTVEDGTGEVDVVLDRNANFQIRFEEEVIGSIVDVTGVLLPAPGGGWIVKPRSTPDVVVKGLVWPELPIIDARAQPVNTRLIVNGVALNGWPTFGDSTVHVRDSTGAIRAVRLPPSGIGAGDSLRVVGTIGLDRDQPVLTRIRSTIQATGLTAPEPTDVTTGEAATARDGARAADLVRIDSAVVRDTTRNAEGEPVLVIEDGSGFVDVVMDRNISFQVRFEEEVIGSILEVVGLLVPAASGDEWTVKPRSNTDISVKGLVWPALPVVEARAQPVNTRLIVQGVALNSWATYGDSTMHVRDATGAIRAVRMPPASVAAGDSIQIIGTIGTLRGQPVLTRVVSTLLAAGLTTPAPVNATTGQAGSAAGGTLDAALVRVAGEIADTARTATGEAIFKVNDGSGVVEVVIDKDVSVFLTFPTDGEGRPIIIGTRMDATGLLVPGPSGTSWWLKPRQAEDVEVGG